MSAIASSTLALQARPSDRAAARAQAYAELQEMSKAMVEEKGLLNYAQAALLLDVSTKRISELVRLRKLKPFDFLGRRYVSMREVGQRYQQDLKAGRPGRGVGKRAPYVRAQVRANKEKNREELRKIWQTITGKRKK